MEIVVLLVVVVGIWVGLRAMATSRRRKWLLAKYADLAIVEAIMRLELDLTRLRGQIRAGSLRWPRRPGRRVIHRRRGAANAGADGG